MSRTKTPTPRKPPLLCGIFGFTQADLDRPRHKDIDALTFARCYSDSYLIATDGNLRRQVRN